MVGILGSRSRRTFGRTLLVRLLARRWDRLSRFTITPLTTRLILVAALLSCTWFGIGIPYLPRPSGVPLLLLRGLRGKRCPLVGEAPCRYVVRPMGVLSIGTSLLRRHLSPQGVPRFLWWGRSRGVKGSLRRQVSTRAVRHFVGSTLRKVNRNSRR